MIVRSNDGLADDVLLSARGVGLCYQSRRKQGGSREFWPFRDLSFEIRSGETLGILGGNGAGKSTLMRVLAGLMQPDEGVLQIRKDINIQLLTIGLGFEQRLTGRENALLSGVLLGKSVAFMREHLNAIKEYSELGDFFEKAVYTYSSGMKARLGFSVAMRVDPEILLLDEVMGVGDAAFRDKSSQAIEEMVFREGKTVVIISHNGRTIKDTCSRAIWIGDHKLMQEGSPEDVVNAYLGNVYSRVAQGKSTSTPVDDDSFLQDEKGHSVNQRKSFVVATQHEMRQLAQSGQYLQLLEVARTIVNGGLMADSERLIPELCNAFILNEAHEELLRFTQTLNPELKVYEVLTLESKALYALGKLEESYNSALSALECNRQSFATYLWLGWLSALNGAYDEFHRYTALFSFLYSRNLSAELNIEESRLIGCSFTRLLIEIREGGESVLNQSQLAYLAYLAADFSHALRCYEDMSETNSSMSFKDRYRMSRISLLSGRTEAARLQLQSILSDKPSFVAGRIDMSYITCR